MDIDGFRAAMGRSWKTHILTPLDEEIAKDAFRQYRYGQHTAVPVEHLVSYLRDLGDSLKGLAADLDANCR